ncbi:MAG TPA: peptide-methionine (S)-S-oxide reductase MsrA [bacterium]|nr:peptide-methionine (S)-S-oxide reductase MsrA [bacterium]
MRHRVLTLVFTALWLILGGEALAGKPKTTTATFAGGCFWCMTPPFEKLEGVLKVTAGYTDGTGANPTYEDYAEKGYTEGVQITYDPTRITYAQLLDTFWKQINPTDPNGQFVDRGPQYRAAIFFHDTQQRKEAEKSRDDLNKSGRYDKPIVVPIKKYASFYPAEDYHQDYYKKNPIHYELYHHGSGRDQYLDSVWGKGKH